MNRFDVIFYTRMKKMLEERHAVILSNIGQGMPTWEDYIKNVGCLYGLQEANEMAEIIKEEMAKE